MMYYTKTVTLLVSKIKYQSEISYQQNVGVQK